MDVDLIILIYALCFVVHLESTVSSDHVLAEPDAPYLFVEEKNRHSFQLSGVADPRILGIVNDGAVVGKA